MRNSGIHTVSFCLVLLLFTSDCSPGGGRVPRLSVALPFGAVDPVGSPQGDGTLKLTGWALSEDPIQTISLYIDGHYVTSARMLQPRPDVNRAYPAYGLINAGWEIELDSRMFSGEHEIVVQAKTVHGASRDLQALPIRLRN
jgi:N-acetylmuramoyl-L-alanine amidase